MNSRGVDIDVTIQAVLVGRAAPLPGGRASSAIVKSPQTRRLRVELDGLVEDEQGDTTHHGGPEKALHHYPREHYPSWVGWMPEHAARSRAFDAPGAFGENLSTIGLTEQDVCVGDVFELGSTLLQVSQGRQPCWKLDLRHDRRGTARRMQELRHTGWYYRVLAPGEIGAGDHLILRERPEPQWSLERVLRALFDRSCGPAEWAAAAQIATLSPGWRATFEDRVSTKRLEDWTKRLNP